MKNRIPVYVKLSVPLTETAFCFTLTAFVVLWHRTQLSQIMANRKRGRRGTEHEVFSSVQWDGAWDPHLADFKKVDSELLYSVIKK